MSKLMVVVVLFCALVLSTNPAAQAKDCSSVVKKILYCKNYLENPKTPISPRTQQCCDTLRNVKTDGDVGKCLEQISAFLPSKARLLPSICVLPVLSSSLVNLIEPEKTFPPKTPGPFPKTPKTPGLLPIPPTTPGPPPKTPGPLPKPPKTPGRLPKPPKTPGPLPIPVPVPIPGLQLPLIPVPLPFPHDLPLPPPLPPGVFLPPPLPFPMPPPGLLPPIWTPTPPQAPEVLPTPEVPASPPAAV